MWIELPGIGTITADKKAAFIDSQNNKIYPSSLILHFTPLAQQRTEEMVQNLSRSTGFTSESIEQSLAKLIFHLTQEIRVRSEVNFEPFGKLFYPKASNILHFEAGKTNLHNSFFNLSEYPLHNINTNKYASSSISSNTDSLTEFHQKIQKSDSVFNRNLLVLIGLLSILFFILLLCPAKKTTIHSTATQKTNDSLNSITLLNKQKSDSTEDSQNSSVIIKNDTVPDSSRTSYLNEEKLNPENAQRLADSVRNKKCVIIVGSFTQKKNAIKMIKFVQKNNYTSYTEMYNQYQRVGIEFDCTKTDLQTMLRELKEKFDPKAWILKW
ncbi:MAG: hypothetical protein IT267_10045 [Saprospiraceae bacterium]|nr:hypothetical protein [Saprospiraceae bacterium]